MENSNKDLPAFAKSAFYHPHGGIDPPQEGLTKREYFAGLAMQGMLANSNRDMVCDKLEDRIQDCISFADELLKQLNQ